jgi:antitoxin YefM
MHSISYTSARGNLAKTMKQVCENHDPVIITRNNSESVVMLSLDDYESLQETNYLLQSPANAARLCESIDELDKGKGKERGLIE